MENPPQKTRKTRNWKINPDKVIELREQGLTCTDIAKHQGVHTSTITRFLDKHANYLDDFITFKNNRDIEYDLALYKQAKIREKIQDSMQESDFSQLKPEQKGRVLRDVETAGGIMYDKHRLETGQTTANIGVGIEARLTKALEKAADNSNAA